MRSGVDRGLVRAASWRGGPMARRWMVGATPTAPRAHRLARLRLGRCSGRLSSRSLQVSPGAQPDLHPLRFSAVRAGPPLRWVQVQRVALHLLLHSRTTTTQRSAVVEQHVARSASASGHGAAGHRVWRGSPRPGARQAPRSGAAPCPLVLLDWGSGQDEMRPGERAATAPLATRPTYPPSRSRRRRAPDRGEPSLPGR